MRSSVSPLTSPQENRAIIAWLVLSALLVFVIVVIGGITRLTGSGLSMVEWQPLIGSIPPLTEAAWQDVFQKYQQSPEFKLVNSTMGLPEFKKIFFWEYVHRMLGRLIGLVVTVPYLIFLLRKQLTRTLKIRGAVIIILVGIQGVLGWYMVKSGLVNVPNVSHLRLASHLLLAFFICQYILWTLYRLIYPESLGHGGDGSQPTNTPSDYVWLRKLGKLLTVGVAIQIMYGAFVSGLKAGYGFNTFPKMGDTWVPDGMFLLPTIVENLVNNPITVQFIHRGIGWGLVVLTMLLFLGAMRSGLNSIQKKAVLTVVGILLIQFLLGVATLVMVIPISLAVIHQVNALILLSSCVFLNYVLRSPRVR